MLKRRGLLWIFGFCLAAQCAVAADAVVLVLKDHQFTPQQVTVPTGQRFRVEVHNQDTTPAEFESSDMRVEKIIVGGGRISVSVGPLKAGTYRFFDDYHPDTAKGVFTAVDGAVAQ